MTRRTERLNDLLREEISDLLQRDLRDPRIGGLVSITEVDVAPDLRNAKVFVSVLGTDEERESTMVALTAAAGFMHRALLKRITIRRIPDLVFLPDISLERGAHILELLAEERKDQTPPQQ